MKFKRIETPGIAHYAYLIGDGGDAALVDPRRDIEDYLAATRALGVQIRYVIETHRQEDFVMGSAYLARRTGARIVNGDHPLFGHGDLRLRDGDRFSIGRLTVRALHTPGHTPESMSYAVYTDQDDRNAWCVFTGDALFFGDTGRTDLPDADKSVDNAALLYDSVHNKLAGLGDTALVFPAHGPGSVCGSGMAERPYSTLGGEKRYNDVFTLDRAAFARKKGGERMPRPPYFRHMEKVNLHGGLDPALRPGDVRLIDIETFAASCAGRLVYDAREPEGFAGGHIEGSYSIWLGGMPVFGGWVGDQRSPIYLVTDREADIDTAALHLTRIGIDNVQGGLAGGFGAWRSSGNPIRTSGVITPQELADARDRFQVLDVREIDEYDQGHIPGARHLYVGYLPDRLDGLELDRRRPVVVTCSVGHRAGLGVSLLLRAGFADVRNLLGGMTAWKKLKLPVE
ncbi:MAG: rhodanese-like domain-containing protein [Pseudomonadota bacterium]|nr:rhodanese-like domain-containing protein [Pseudomonadota bacterium]